MIKLGNLKNISPNCNDFDEIWLIVRSTKTVLPEMLNNPKVRHVPDLSPSMDLFFAYQRWVKENVWSRELFEQLYVPKFMEEIKGNDNALSLLNQLKIESSDKNIALMCFCNDERICHRSIIGGILMNMGADIKCNGLYEKYSL